MANKYDEAGKRWNSNAFGSNNVDAVNLAALSDSTKASIDRAIAETQRNNAINASLVDALAFKPQTPGTSPRPVARPTNLSEALSGYSQSNAGSGGGALNANWDAVVPASLVFTESSGNWNADRTNSDGRRFVGALQFGQARLNDMIKAGVLPQGTTLDQLKASPEMQVKAGNWHFQDYKDRIFQNGLDMYIGKTIQGSTQPLTLNSLLAMAHLGGFGGMTKTLRSGGRSNPTDQLGTSLVNYANTHSN